MKQHTDFHALRAAGLTPCGDTLTYIHDQITDEEGHRVAYVHADTVHRLRTGNRAAADLHQADPEGIVPLCRECAKAHPCPTLRALDTTP